MQMDVSQYAFLKQFSDAPFSGVFTEEFHKAGHEIQQWARLHGYFGRRIACTVNGRKAIFVAGSTGYIAFYEYGGIQVSVNWVKLEVLLRPKYIGFLTEAVLYGVKLERLLEALDDAFRGKPVIRKVNAHIKAWADWIVREKSYMQLDQSLEEFDQRQVNL